MEHARQVRIELEADWLMMAAWLTWLKSKLLLPQDDALQDVQEATRAIAGPAGGFAAGALCRGVAVGAAILDEVVFARERRNV